MNRCREGKPWAGFGVPGLNHVFVAKSAKYPKHLDGSPILPPGTLGKTAGFVSVHAPKSMISIARQGNLSDIEEDDEDVDEHEHKEQAVQSATAAPDQIDSESRSRPTPPRRFHKLRSIEAGELLFNFFVCLFGDWRTNAHEQCVLVAIGSLSRAPCRRWPQTRCTSSTSASYSSDARSSVVCIEVKFKIISKLFSLVFCRSRADL